MEILLLEDINGVGKRNDLLVVGDGFALNFLLPNRKALVATPTVRKRYADQIKRRAEEKENEKKLQQDAAAVLAGKAVVIAHKVAKGGKLYEKVSEEQIVVALREQHQFTATPAAILIDEPIKALGKHQVQLKIGEGSLSLTVEVVEQKAEKAKKAA